MAAVFNLPDEKIASVRLQGEGSPDAESPLPPSSYMLYVSHNEHMQIDLNIKKPIILQPHIQIKIRLYYYIHFNKSFKKRSHLSMFLLGVVKLLFLKEPYFLCIQISHKLLNIMYTIDKLLPVATRKLLFLKLICYNVTFHNFHEV